MTEEVWLKCDSCAPMLNWLCEMRTSLFSTIFPFFSKMKKYETAFSKRKRSLCAVAIIRRLRPSPLPDLYHKGCVAVERFVDGCATEEDRQPVEEILRQQGEARPAYTYITYLCFRLPMSQEERVYWQFLTSVTLENHGGEITEPLPIGDEEDLDLDQLERLFAPMAEEQGHVADILRHIIGNPFRPYSAPTFWPPAVVQLAQALYNGEDCAFALHDALLEAGQPELAEHFTEKDHPKGCWPLDLILVKA